MGTGRVGLHKVGQARGLHHGIEHGLRHWRATDVAHADKENTGLDAQRLRRLVEGSLNLFVVVERVIFLGFLIVKNYAARMPEAGGGRSAALGGTST